MSSGGGTIDSSGHYVYPNVPAGNEVITVTDSAGGSAQVTITSLVPAYSMCSATAVGASGAGRIRDSGGDLADYQDDENCSFAIHAGTGSTITLSFEFFDLETGYDYLYVYDGAAIPANLLAQLDGNALPGPLTAASGLMTLVFVADYSVTRPGFTLAWTSTPGAPKLVAPSGRIDPGSTTLLRVVGGEGPYVFAQAGGGGALSAVSGDVFVSSYDAPAANESLSFLVTDATGATSSASVSVMPALTFAQTAFSAAESAAGTAFQLQLSAPTNVSVSVPYAIAGTSSNPADHGVADGTLFIPAGSASVSLPVSLVNDSVFEWEETVSFTLGSVTGALLEGGAVSTLTIQDDDNFSAYVLDSAFNGSGKFTRTEASEGIGGAFDSLGRIVVAGIRFPGLPDVAVWRILDTGVADTGFGTSGGAYWGVGMYDNGKDVVIAPGDKPLVGGYFDGGAPGDRHTLWQFSTAGVLDATFSGDGRAEIAFAGDTQAMAMAQDPVDSSVYLCGGVSGDTYAAISRFNPDGTAHAGFNAGKVTFNAFASQRFLGCKVDSARRIVAAGWMSAVSSGQKNLLIVRYTATGALDASFGGAGYVVVDGAGAAGYDDVGKAMLLDVSDDVYVTGSTANGTLGGMAVWKIKSDGTPDTTFGGTGYLADYSASSATLSSSGNSLVFEPVTSKLLIAGQGAPPNQSHRDMVVWRVLANGQLDPTLAGPGYLYFDGQGAAKDDWGNRILIDSSNRPVVIGASTSATNTQNMTLWRFSPN